MDNSLSVIDWEDIEQYAKDVLSFSTKEAVEKPYITISGSTAPLPDDFPIDCEYAGFDSNGGYIYNLDAQSVIDYRESLRLKTMQAQVSDESNKKELSVFEIYALKTDNSSFRCHVRELPLYFVSAIGNYFRYTGAQTFPSFVAHYAQMNKPEIDAVPLSSFQHLSKILIAVCK